MNILLVCDFVNVPTSDSLHISRHLNVKFITISHVMYNTYKFIHTCMYIKDTYPEPY